VLSTRPLSICSAGVALPAFAGLSSSSFAASSASFTTENLAKATPSLKASPAQFHQHARKSEGVRLTFRFFTTRKRGKGLVDLTHLARVGALAGCHGSTDDPP
jgi:hypothetical protein